MNRRVLILVAAAFLFATLAAAADVTLNVQEHVLGNGGARAPPASSSG